MKKKFAMLLNFGLLTGLFAANPPLADKAQYKITTIKSLNLNLSWEEVQINPISGNELKVEIYCNKKRFVPSVSISSNTLVIKSAPSQYTLLPEYKNCTVILNIPETSKFDSVDIGVTSGEVTCNYNFNAELVRFDSTSGEISIAEVKAKTFTIDSTSGNVKTEKIVSQTIDARCTSGSIMCKGFTGNRATFKTTSGSIRLKNINTNELICSSTSGMVSLDESACDMFNVSTTSGSVGLELLRAPKDSSKATSTSGLVFLSLPEDSRLNLNVSTTSGSFTNAITREKLSSHVDYSAQINGGGTKIILSSTSGNITLDKGSLTSADPVPVINFESPIFDGI